MYLECLLQLWQYKHKPSPCHFLLLHSSGSFFPSVTHIVSPYQGPVMSVNITSVWAALSGDLESGPGDLISIFHEMSWAETRGKDVVLWNQLIQRFLLLHSLRFLEMITLNPFLFSPSNHFNPESVVTNALLSTGYLLRPQLLKDLCWDYLRYWRLVTCAWSLCALETTGAITCGTWSVQCSTTWHRLYCAVHCTVLSTPHQTIIGTSSPHGLDDK